MGQGSGIREVAWVDIPGGGQVVLDGNYAYVGHMQPPHGTSVLDVADPANPRIIASIDIPPGLHSHKVRVANDIMVTNRERTRGEKPADDFVGLRIFDISRPGNPRDICHWQCAGTGVHRFTFDGRYAYISTEQEGYIGTIVMILDLKDPTRPEEVGRWWMQGQWAAGGETPSWKGKKHRCHHPIRRGNRLYVSYWYGGGVILGELIAKGQGPVAAQELSKVFRGPIIAAGGFEPDTAETAVASGDASLVAFGRHFIANPDLPKRIAFGVPLNPYDRRTFYAFDAGGYTDYPAYERQEAGAGSGAPMITVS